MVKMASLTKIRAVSKCIQGRLRVRTTSESFHSDSKVSDIWKKSHVQMPATSSVRFFSDNNRGEGSKDPPTPSPSSIANDEDPFGVNYKDVDTDGENDESTVNTGPDLPPNYIRDSATGKFTGKIQKELSSKDAHLLKLSQLAKGQALTNKFAGSLSNKGLEDSSRRIREQESAFNILGRKVPDVSEAIASEAADGIVAGSHTAPLTDAEFRSLEKFMQKSSTGDHETKTINSVLQNAKAENLIPIVRKSSAKHPSSAANKDESDPDLDLEWTTVAAQSSMTDLDEEDLEDPFANLMPSDLNPAKKVNRKRAKPLPRELLHHNNLALLRRYVTPGGQIMNRVQSRLGAKDQRKISKLIKRARHLGLIPVLGQWKVEDHGNVKEKDILENRDWEKELLERGLIEAKSSVYGRSDNNSGGGTGAMW